MLWKPPTEALGAFLGLEGALEPTRRTDHAVVAPRQRDRDTQRRHRRELRPGGAELGVP